jgi:hypothetical protein
MFLPSLQRGEYVRTEGAAREGSEGSTREAREGSE